MKIDIGRLKPGLRVSIKGAVNQKAFGITPAQIAAGDLPRIGFVNYTPATRAFYFRVGREGLQVTNSAGVIEHGIDMRVTFPKKGSFRFTDALVSMATYDAQRVDGDVFVVTLPEGLVLEQTDNVLARAGL